MCNIEEDTPIERPRGEAKIGRICMKCSKDQAIVVVRLNDPLCQSCFMVYFIHKFRATIGKARVIRHEDKVLLAVSGGPASLAMLKLVCEGVSEDAVKKFRFRPAVLYVDEGAVLDMNEAERAKLKQDIKEFVIKNGNFDFYAVKLEDLYHPRGIHGVNSINENNSACAVEQLQSCFNSVCTLTAKEDLLKSLRRKITIDVALKEGYPKVMVGECATRISVQLLSNISQGRGEVLSFDTGFVDNRHGDVTFLRPMREFVAKEVSLYNFFQKIESINVHTLATKSYCYASIDRLTEEFIGGLQAQFPFTVNTIFRTGDKLTGKENYDADYHCTLCGLPLVLQGNDHLATKVEQLKIVTNPDAVTLRNKCTEDDKISANSEVTVEDCCSTSESGEIYQQSKSVTKHDMAKTLCYGCSLTFKDMKEGLKTLPSQITEFAGKQLHSKQAELRNQIDEFLLPE